MKIDIKSKLSTDFGLIKKGVVSRVAELAAFGGKCEQNVGAAVGRKETIKDLPHKLLGKWNVYLQRKNQSLGNFSLWNLCQETARARKFTSSFFVRPGIIKLHVVNFSLNVMYWVVRLFTLTIFVILVVGVVILVIYGLDAAIGWITELIDNLRSKDPSGIPKGVE